MSKAPLPLPQPAAEQMTTRRIQAQVQETIRDAFNTFREREYKRTGKKITSFFYFKKDGTFIEEAVSEPSYTRRRRYAAARTALRQNGLPIPQGLGTPAYTRDEDLVPQDLPQVELPRELPHLEPFTLPGLDLEPFEIPKKK